MAVARAGRLVRPADIVDTMQALAPTDYAPSISGLTKGSGWSDEGWWTRVGPMLVAHYAITLGTSPSFSAAIAVDLPPGMAPLMTGEATVLGSWIYRDDSALDWYAGSVGYLSSTTCRLLGAWDGTAPRERVGLSGTTPVTPAVSDKISFQLAYLLA